MEKLVMKFAFLNVNSTIGYRIIILLPRWYYRRYGKAACHKKASIFFHIEALLIDYTSSLVLFSVLVSGKSPATERICTSR